MTASSSSGPTRLGVLLSETVEYCKAHWQALLLGVVVFGAILGALSAAFGVHTARTIGMGMMNQMGLDMDRMAELSMRIESGDETAMTELETIFDTNVKGMSDEDIARQFQGSAMQAARALAPAFGLSFIISLLVSFFAHAYYALVAVEGKDMNATLRRAGTVMLPLVGVSIWSFLRSFLWIPIIGIIPAIFLGPRFVAAPLVYLTEQKSVTASVSESYRRTSGYWPKIVGNIIIAGLLMAVVTSVLNMVLGLFLIPLPGAIIVARSIVGQVGMAFATVFVVRLSATVLKNPVA